MWNGLRKDVHTVPVGSGAIALSHICLLFLTSYALLCITHRTWLMFSKSSGACECAWNVNRQCLGVQQK
jgi:hypothetical protein